MNGAVRVLVFARAPVPGRCKTRLARRLGVRGAAAIHRALCRRTLRTALDSGLAVELWCEPDARHGFFLDCRRNRALRLRRQARGDLGRKMAHALDDALRRGAAGAIVIGTDCPALSAQDLLAAAAALQSGETVLQPALDGGYVLLGSRVALGAALAGISWSSGREQQQTRTRLQRRGLTCTLLEPRWDVDHPADLRRARSEGLIGAPAARS